MSRSKIKGLTAEQVTRSREMYGRNVLTPVRRESVWRVFLAKFNDPIIKLLLAAALLSLVVGIVDGHYSETIGIICAVLLATCVSFWFEYDARRRFEVLNVVDDDAPVKAIRDAEVMGISKKDIVVGDIILLESGDEVPADARLTEAVSLAVDESSLTGEPSATKSVDPSKFDTESTYPSDMVMKGSTVTQGHAVAEVTAVGDSTEYGKVAEQATVESGADTPLNRQLRRLSSLISRTGAVLAVTIFVVLVLKGIFIDETLTTGSWLDIAGGILRIFMVCVAIMVMAVPEGLPMSITLSLAMSMRRMLKTNNLVRKMDACETMGAVTVICTDKTGTLTMNRMTVSEMVTYNGTGKNELARMIALNSTAYLDGSGKPIGNPTEGALLLWMASGGCAYDELRASAPIVDQITFSTERKFMATLVTDGGSRRLLVKGAPEVVLAMCSDEGTAGVEESLARFQSDAMRTLAFASAGTAAPTCAEALQKECLTLDAVAAISDPVRADVPGAVRRCLDAGIDIKIVTGDTAATARRIASQIGLWDEEDGEDNILTGPQFEALSDEELLGRLEGLKIMARARPLDKQRLVKLLRRKGEVVAVTGDGTNDAPALNFADVGLAMGTGTPVAKQAGDIILIDDSFASIATAVMWGRSLYRNIQRFVMFQLTVNLSALAIVFIGSIFGRQMPLTVTQILWVNIIMDTFAAMALASLPPSPCVMEDRPRSPDDFIIGRGMLRRIVGIGTLMVAAMLGMLFIWGRGLTPYRLSVFFTVFVMLQFWNLFNARGWRSGRGIFGNIAADKGFLAVSVLILTGQIIITTFGGEIFRTVPLSLRDWFIIIASTSAVAFIGLTLRLASRRKK
ncbi:MAG: calcium-translocating P-type ATPase, PMCA-type [Rikenellaceae bacterium]|nr:calcium-translocating P-type ATPase, PMCA-type [Rikenellaceae bacterium]